jgi:formylglycine-generating enzyme required for sulfatase activity
MTTFISYSRVNSEFVVRLAKDLKGAGFDVWLDQLDIPKGARWDDAIEAAVERSSTFMIVLAPESIESQNVKDELSYAIDSGKHLLPVVIRPCKIPLRLRRFQYVDFTDKPYKESLADIKRLLSNTQRLMKPQPEAPVHEAGSPSPLVTGPLVPPELLTPLESFREEEPRNQNRLHRFILPVSLGVIALATMAGAAVFAMNRNEPPPPAPTVVTVTSTPVPPTLTFTSTAIPLPLEVPDEHGVTMRLVSAGDFLMGSEAGLEDEQQVQMHFLDTFYIDKYEVTNLQYRACVQAGACLPPQKINSSTRTGYYNKPEFNSYPVVYVDWNMARSYCEWRSARLPTEAEWEKAARGPDGSNYPWGDGDDISCEQANYSGCQKDTISVSSLGNAVSAYGVYNMAGNVYEWVSSLYKPYPYDLFDGREDLEAPGERVIRGGSWRSVDSKGEVRSSHREKADSPTAREDIGFRCLRTPDDSLLDFALVVSTPLNSSTATADVATRRSRKTEETRQALSTLVSPPPASRTPNPTPTVVTVKTPTARTPVIEPTDTSEPPPNPTDTSEPPPNPTDTSEPPPNPTDTSEPSYP